MINWPKKHKIRNLFFSLIIPCIFLSVSLSTINDYGETTDEKFDQHIGEFYYYQWKQKGLEGLNERFIELQRNYGPFFDIIVVAANDFLHQKTSLISNSVASYHLPVIIISSIAIWIVFLYAYFNWGFIPAFLSSLTLALMPRFIGDSQNNLKDTPMMAFFSISLFCFFLSFKKKKIFLYLLSGFFLGLTYTIKINALIILPIVCLGFLMTNKLSSTRVKRFMAGFSLSLMVAFITVLIFWPYYRYSPHVRFVETFKTFNNHVWNEYVLYLGRHWRGQEIPWHYPLVMLAITMPLFYLGFFLIGIIMAIFYFCSRRPERSSLIYLVIWLVFPPLIQILSDAPKYDGIRHFLVVLPSISLFIGFATWQTGKILKGLNQKVYPLYVLIIFLGYLSVLRTDIRLHPYQVVYFNQLTGGVKGAKGKFDLEYWGHSLKEAAEWINSNLPDNSRIWLTMPMAHHFPIDSSRFQLVDQYPDYKVNLIRGMLKTWDPEDNYLNPKKTPIYAINVDGADILQIFEYPENHPVADVISLEPLTEKMAIQNNGLKITTFPNTQFKGAPLEQSLSSSIGFDCLGNPYYGKPMSLRYDGYLYIPGTNTYCFQIMSDDGARLKLNDTTLITNPSMKTSFKEIILNPGYYRFQLEYTNKIDAACLDFSWSTANCQDFKSIPSNLIFN